MCDWVRGGGYVIGKKGTLSIYSMILGGGAAEKLLSKKGCGICLS